jgi:hypothetical protein
MIYPNKHLRVHESVIYKMVHVLENRQDGSINIHDLYISIEKYFQNIDEFIVALDVLYALDMIELDFKTEMLSYVKGVEM